MKTLPEASIDAVITDPPYGSTALQWDERIDLPALWKELNRVVRPKGYKIFFAAQPFATDLINSQRKQFRYELIWHKTRPVGFLDANVRPLRAHENILIFNDAGITGSLKDRCPTYHPQLVKGRMHQRGRPGSQPAHYHGCTRTESTRSDEFHPRSVLTFSHGNCGPSLHPTQKPLELVKWLVLSYTNPGDLILDPFAGSGTTALACAETGRHCIAMERDADYMRIARKRLEAWQRT